eukprot:gene1379-32746_t
MVILVRGTLTKYEWMINFDYAFTNFEKVDPRLEGMAHSCPASQLALKDRVFKPESSEKVNTILLSFD